MTQARAQGRGPSFPWAGAAPVTHYYLDILAKDAGVEAEPVGGDVEPALEKKVPLEGTGAHWEVTGEETAMSKVSWQPRPGRGPHPQESRVEPQGLSFSEEPHSSNNPPQAPRVFS